MGKEVSEENWVMVGFSLVGSLGWSLGCWLVMLSTEAWYTRLPLRGCFDGRRGKVRINDKDLMYCVISFLFLFYILLVTLASIEVTLSYTINSGWNLDIPGWNTANKTPGHNINFAVVDHSVSEMHKSRFIIQTIEVNSPFEWLICLDIGFTPDS